MGLAFKEIAIRLQIGVGTAHRLYARYVDTGDVAPKMQPARPDASWITFMNCTSLHLYMKTQPFTFMKFVLR